MKSCVIFNPAAQGDKAQQFRESLTRVAAAAALKPTTAPGAGRHLAAEAVREGFDLIVAAGGDGTLNEVLNGIGDVSAGFERVRLGVMPLGTINVFARELGLPPSVEEAWRVIEAGRVRVVDLPVADFIRDGAPVRRYFGQLAGAGLDSRAIDLVDLTQKKKIGPLAYVVAGVKAMGQFAPQITVTAGETSAEGQLVLIGNGRYYGGSFELFPQANLEDGLLDVTVFAEVDWPMLVRAGWGLLTSKLQQSTGCRHFQASKVSLASLSSVPFELDGDNVGSLPATFSVRPGALRVVVP